MTLQQLEYILAVDTHRHFARAAEFCNVTQPTLSAMIQKLEDELKVKIFDRNTQPVSPTMIGRMIIEQANVVVKQSYKIRDIVAEEQNTIQGVFRLAVLPTIAPYLLPRFFQKFMAKYPLLDIRVMEMKTQQSMMALKNGDVDAAIIANEADKDFFNSYTLYYEEFFVYISRGEKLFTKERIKTSDITGERLWLLDEGHCFRDQLVKFCQLEKVKLNQMAYSLGSMETFMRMVEKGKGITFIPSLAIMQFSDEQKELVRPFAIPTPTRNINIITTKSFIRNSVLDAIKEEIKSAIPAEMISLKSTQYLL